MCLNGVLAGRADQYVICVPAYYKCLTCPKGALAGAETLCAGYGVTLDIALPPATTAETTAGATQAPVVTAPPTTTTEAANVSSNTTSAIASVFTGAAPQAEFFVSGAFLAGAGFLLALF
jgi:hypothetical protein